MADAVVPLKR